MEKFFYWFVLIDVFALSMWNMYLIITTPGFSNIVITLASILSAILRTITAILIRNFL